jgi:hypothetical protein
MALWGAMALWPGLVRAQATDDEPAPPTTLPSGYLHGEVSSELWLPLFALGESIGRPSSLLGGQLQLARPLVRSASFELRVALSGGYVASNQGGRFPVGSRLQVKFSTLPGVFAALSAGGGWLVGAALEVPAQTWTPVAHSAFLEGAMTPLGFRFGPEGRGELSLRFGLIRARVQATTQEPRWAFAAVSSGAWLGYFF